ncbi:MAG: nitrous oxide reductase family maturation protein NosD [Candidatus Sigynarchaeum springense]
MKKLPNFALMISILFTSAILCSYFCIEMVNFDKSRSASKNLGEIRQATPHPVIVVDGDVELGSVPGITGNGIEGDPFVLDSFEINGTGSSYGIYIRNTKSWLRISHCSIFKAYYGILLENCTNVVVEHNNITYNTDTALKIENCRNISVNSNNLEHSDKGLWPRYVNNTSITNNNVTWARLGMYLDRCLNVSITYNNASRNSDLGCSLNYCTVRSPIKNNTFDHNAGNGFSVSGTNNTNITGNYARYNGGSGIALSSSFNSIIASNIVLHNKVGIELNNFCNGTKVVRNNASFNTEAGLKMESIRNVTVSNNNLTWNNYGARLSFTSNITFSMNNVSWNDRNGLDCFFSSNNTVKNNELSNNGGSGLYLSVGQFNHVFSNNMAFNQANGATIYGYNNNSLYSNIIAHNFNHGISIEQTHNNTVYLNNVTSSGRVGINVEYSHDNLIFTNRVCGSGWSEGYCSGTGNKWDNGSRGNWWGDYKARYPYADFDAVEWKTPYQINTTTCHDNHPLILYPVVSHPPDLVYLEGTTGHKITWVVNGSAITTGLFNITRDGTFLMSSGWTSGTPIEAIVDGLSEGEYEYKLVAWDGTGETCQDIVWVIVNVAPAIETPPSDIIYVYGESGNEISWIITDTSMGTATYLILQNGSSVDSGSWISGDPVTINVDGLAVGDYNYTIIADDGLGGIIVDEVIVHVINLDPTITNPADITCDRGGTSVFVNWTITDSSVAVGGSYFKIYLDNVFQYSDLWVPEIPVSVLVNWFNVGVHNLTIIAYDGWGGSVADQVNVTVLNVAPVLNSPPIDISYEFNGGGFNWVCWTFHDDSIALGAFYEIYVDGGLVIYSTEWNSGTDIWYRVDFLSLGDHNVTIRIDDGYGSTLQDEVTVHVYNVDPVVTHPADVSFVQGTSGNSISWTVTDLSYMLHNYSIFVDGVKRASGYWNSGSPIHFNVDSLSVGTHNVTIVVDDGITQVQDTVIVTVQARTIPPDNTALAMFIVLICVSGAAGVGIVVIVKKKKGLSRRDASESK